MISKSEAFCTVLESVLGVFSCKSDGFF